MNRTTTIRLVALVTGVAAVAAGAFAWGIGASGSSGNELAPASVSAAPSESQVSTAANVPSTGSANAPAAMARFAVDDNRREIPRGEFQRLFASAPAEQRAVLEDGVVTRDELAAAHESAHACAVDATTELPGVRFETPWWGGSDFRWGFQADTRELLDRAGASYDACRAKFVSTVGEAWSMAKAYERLLPLWHDMAVCMNAEGVAVADDADWNEMKAAGKAANRGGLVDMCSGRAQAYGNAPACLRAKGAQVADTATFKELVAAAASVGTPLSVCLGQ